MTETNKLVQEKTWRRVSGRPMPQVFTRTSWRRFSRDRHRAYLADLSAPPTTEQVARIDSLVRHEWAALKAEAIGTLAADREAREHRRLFNRLLADHAEALRPPTAPREQPRRRGARLNAIIGGRG